VSEVTEESEMIEESAEHRRGLEPHGFRAAPFVFGLAFAAVGVVGTAGFSADVATAWLWVVALGVFGVAGVVAALSRN